VHSAGTLAFDVWILSRSTISCDHPFLAGDVRLCGWEAHHERLNCHAGSAYRKVISQAQQVGLIESRGSWTALLDDNLATRPQIRDFAFVKDVSRRYVCTTALSCISQDAVELLHNLRR
jgi:hypothetical protein